MLRCIDDETIVAQATPSGSGAIALIRMSGIDALTIVNKISRLSSKKLLSEQSSHTIHHGWVVNNDHTVIDQVLFFLMKGPRTFTGQDTVEISCHNNPFIIQDIINAALLNGARLAHPGEFTKRSVLNNKITLVQAEAIKEIIHANTQQALKSSLAQLDGSLSSWIFAIEKKLLQALSLSEASFEFLDDEVEFADQIRTIIDETSTLLVSIKKNFNQQTHIRNGLRIAIVGSVNAGKSSLFNTLLNQKRAIVTPIAGTTRDAIEFGTYIYGSYITFVDTAGIRQTDDVIEQEGIQRSYQEIERADIALIVFDGSRSITSEEKEIYDAMIKAYNHKALIVINKADLQCQLSEAYNTSLFVSSANNNGIELLHETLEKHIKKIFEQEESPFLLNSRQHAILIDIEKKLHSIISILNKPIAYELLSYHIQDVLSQLSELSGKTISEKAMDTIFKEFCVGK